ncbi:MAG: AEC family transporter [Defluviitaleaceae bacterium]|nr:AEC family transporter [Defluviitaleaceae bacterium]
MIENFIFSINAVVPIFSLIGFGYILRQKAFLSEPTINELNRLVFTFALPAILFRSTYQVNFSELFNPRLIGWVLGSIALSFIVFWFFAELFLRKKRDLISSFVQGAYRANYAVMGIPLVANIMGEYDTGMTALSVAFVVILYNVLAVIVFTAKGSDRGFSFALFKDVLIGLFKNPSIIGSFLGLAVNLSGIQMPQMASDTVGFVATLGTPLALLAVGGSMQISAVREYLKAVIACTAAKIVVMPLAVVLASIQLGFRGEELALIFAVSANPTAMISYVMATRMGGNPDFTSSVILMTTAFSLVTITAGVYLLMVFGLV